MSIDKDTVKHISKLARISLDEKKINEMRKAADNVFREGMQAAEPKVAAWKSNPCFWSVRPFGRWAIRKAGMSQV